MYHFKSLSGIKKRKNILSNIKNKRKNKISKELLISEKTNHFKYHKLYNISKSTDNSFKKENDRLRIKTKYQKQFEILKKVFKNPKKSNIQNLTKLTKPQLPFSSRKEIDPETKKKKIISLSPSLKYHDIHTIKWLKKKYSNAVFEKSLNTLLPDNGKPVIPKDESEEEKKHRIFLEFLESLKPVIDKEKNVNINPKYFFDKNTFEKVLKLKKIFLEFDEDGSRKMELDEMFTMFNQNNINADFDELVHLFFKKKKFKKENIMNLYLDFYQFMQFALNKEQEFRNFMREIKQKYKKENYQNYNNKNENDNTYLPMSFNLVLDYFITKGKERSAIEKINKSINAIDNILYKGKKNKSILNLNLSYCCNEKRRNSFDIQDKKALKRLSVIRTNIPKLTVDSSKSLNKDDDSFSDKIENKEYYEQLEKINFREPIKEFEKLFKAHGVNITEKKNTNTNTKLNLNVNAINNNNSYEKKINKLYGSTHNSILSDN